MISLTDHLDQQKKPDLFLDRSRAFLRIQTRKKKEKKVKETKINEQGKAKQP